jgi:uncharacterized protein Yka (UPF0111/DUF47 family)
MLRIMPRQQVYFDSYELCARASAEASANLARMLESPDSFSDFVPAIEANERAGDQATAAVLETLQKNLTTPFERAEVRALAETLDDVLDGIDTVAHKLVMYRARKVRAEARELAELLIKLTDAVERAVVALRASRNAGAVLDPCREVHALEVEADRVLRRGIAALFDELTDPFELIKWKEILEILEQTTDKCEDAVRIIEEVVRKHA